MGFPQTRPLQRLRPWNRWGLAFPVQIVRAPMIHVRQCCQCGVSAAAELQKWTIDVSVVVLLGKWLRCVCDQRRSLYHRLHRLTPPAVRPRFTQLNFTNCYIIRSRYSIVRGTLAKLPPCAQLGAKPEWGAPKKGDVPPPLTMWFREHRPCYFKI